MGTVTSRTSVQAQTKVLTASFYSENKEVAPLYTQFMNVITPDAKRSALTVLPLAGLGTTEFKPEGAAPAYDQPYELIPISATFATWALAVKATEEGEMEDPENMVGEIPKQLAKSSRVSKDLVINQILNLAFNPNVLYSDGQPLCSAIHPLGPVSSPTGVYSSIGATFSNLLNGVALTPEALQQARILFSTLVTDRGLPDERTPVQLMVTPQMEKVAEEISGADRVPFSNDNQPNVLAQKRTKIGVCVNRYLTNQNAWFLLGKQGNPFKGGDNHQLFAAFKWQSKFKAWEDDETGNYNQKVSDRYCYGAAGWRGLVGSSGSAGNL